MTREEEIRRVEFCRDFLANNYSDMGEPNFMALNMAIKALKQKPKTGNWIFKDKDDQACLIYTCNQCGEQISIFDDRIKSPQEGHYNYCPNCGAEMKEGEKHE